MPLLGGSARRAVPFPSRVLCSRRQLQSSELQGSQMSRLPCRRFCSSLSRHLALASSLQGHGDYSSRNAFCTASETAACLQMLMLARRGFCSRPSSLWQTQPPTKLQRAAALVQELAAQPQAGREGGNATQQASRAGTGLCLPSWGCGAQQLCRRWPHRPRQPMREATARSSRIRVWLLGVGPGMYQLAAQPHAGSCNWQAESSFLHQRGCMQCMSWPAL